MPRTFTITAPCRLHFGMFSFGQPSARQFGGVGAMIERPRIVTRWSEAGEFAATGPLAERAAAFARRVGEALGIALLPRVRIEIVEAPPEHAGLGVGTQLGLSIAAGLTKWLDDDSPLDPIAPDPIALARLADRGRRSAVGTYGFAQGGLIVEAGHFGDDIAPLVRRIEMPETWRFVLIRPPIAAGRSGEDERRAFAGLPPVPLDATARLAREALLEMIPAADERNFARFAASIDRFNREAGECFAAVQGSPYAGPAAARWVETLRRCGAGGAGQSSWGPTLFGLVENELDAERLAAALRREPGGEEIAVAIAPPADRGARIEF